MADAAALRGASADGLSAKEVRRNTWLLILNGGVMFTAMTFVSSEMVLPAFVQEITTSGVMIGLAGALMRIGWAWPQVFTSRIVESRQKKMPLFLLAGTGRSALWVALGALTIWAGNGHPGFLLASFMILYAAATSLMGITNVPWMDIIGKAIPSRERGRMFSLRRLLGGGMSMAAGALISYLLSERSGFPFPSNYGVLFILSGFGTGLSIAIFGMIREPIAPVQPKRLSLGAYMASGMNLLREDANYRRLCAVQFLWAFGMMATPFYVPYALSGFGIGAAYVGLFVSLMQFSSILSNVLWAYLATRRGEQVLMVWGSYFLGLSCAVPLLAWMVPDRAVAPLAGLGVGTSLSLRAAFYSLTFVFSGFATSAMFTGRMTYVLEIAPPDRRPTYTSFMNVFMLPQGLLPILAGALVSWISYEKMFAIALTFVPLSIAVSRRLKQARQEWGSAPQVPRRDR